MAEFVQAAAPVAVGEVFGVVILEGFLCHDFTGFDLAYGPVVSVGCLVMVRDLVKVG
jgi:hypothetical protein